MEGPDVPDFRAADGREIMMHPRSEFPQLAVPGVGYLQNLSIERDLIGRVHADELAGQQFVDVRDGLRNALAKVESFIAIA